MTMSTGVPIILFCSEEGGGKHRHREATGFWSLYQFGLGLNKIMAGYPLPGGYPLPEKK